MKKRVELVCGTYLSDFNMPRVYRLDPGFCPWGDRESCFSDCPFFDYDEKAHTLSLSCSGIFVPIPLEDKNEVA